jgi:uncharacterized protein YyaL (SSP411 family)
MERDSFEREDVARVLNESFVSIKVDREELPDVDQIYMDVVIGIHGHGGWPMSVFLTPDRKPFWGGTFFYRDSFIRILEALAESWRSDRERVLTSSDELTAFLATREPKAGGGLVDPQLVGLAAEQLLGRFDRENGGFGGAPKFPPSQQLALLMAVQRERGDAASGEVVNKTLTELGCGGIFDHLGGGFHRYSVDAEWLVPHFEKMLYDNALLVPVFIDGFRLTGEPRYRAVALETLDYLLRDMRAEEGAFYSAEDAGEVDREGEYYVWNRGELEAALGRQVASHFADVYRVTEQGNFERGSSVLSLDPSQAWAPTQSEELRSARSALLNARGARPRPHRDNKILTGWNGLCLIALCRGYAISADPRYRDAAQESAEFILSALRPNGTLLRRYCDGEAGFEANLEDYAYLIRGLLELYQVSGDSKWLEAAVSLSDEQHRVLWLDQASAYASSARPGNITRKCEWDDGATPAPNAIALGNLLIIEALTGESRFADWAARLESGAPEELAKLPMAYSSLLVAVMTRAVGVRVVAVIEADATEAPPAQAFELWRGYHPFTWVAWTRGGSKPAAVTLNKLPEGGKTTFFVCHNRSCSTPMLELKRVVEVCFAGSSVLSKGA